MSGRCDFGDESNSYAEKAFPKSRTGTDSRAENQFPGFNVDSVSAEFLNDFRGLLFLQTTDGPAFAPVGWRFGRRNPSLSSVPVVRIKDAANTGSRPANPIGCN